jgi:iron complex outermembrane receptor protein
MLNKRILCVLLAVVCLGVAGSLAAQDTGRVEGRLTRPDGAAVAGAAVAIEGVGATVTGADGRFAFDAVPAGDHTVSFTLGENATQQTVTVAAGATQDLAVEVDWELSFVETITVFSASRRAERIVEAPAAVTIVTEEEVERQAAHGQLPKLLEFTPGAEVTQSGVYDYNFNTRGFNSSLNRRVATLIDGRDPSVPFLGSQEWAAVSFPLDDLASVELVRGPSAALYGANASSGVLNLVTKAPRDSQGGQVRVAAGELSTLNADARWAGGVTEDLYFKVQGGIRDSGDFARSRNVRGEYAALCSAAGQTDCLPREVVPLDPEDDDSISFGSARFDAYLGEAGLFTVEGGLADVEGPVFQTGIGRVQVQKAERTWTRANLSYPHWNLLAYWNERDASRQLAMSSGANLVLDDSNWALEGQTNWDFAGGDARIVGGLSYGEEEIDSFDPRTGRQTLLFEPVDADFTGLFGQLDWALGERWKLVVAGRYDESSLHDSQFSPKGAAVFSINPHHTLRLTYNEAFQVANYSEYFLQAPAAPPANLAGVNALVCLANGVNCGLGLTPVLALGNKDLELEEVETWELGYNAILGGRTFLTVDYYQSENSNFITDLLPQLGTALGRINPNFGPWQPPAGVPEALATVVRGLVPLLSNNVDGSNILAAASYTNFGDVDTEGIDLGVNHYRSDGWTLTFNYSWFDFEIQDPLPGLERLLLPNSPPNKLAAGAIYVQDRFDLGGSFRWVDDFRWAVGPFQGDIEAYYTVDLNGNYRIGDHWTVGATVANVTDNEHWEAWGGDLIGRRALAHVAFAW